MRFDNPLDGAIMTRQEFGKIKLLSIIIVILALYLIR